MKVGRMYPPPHLCPNTGLSKHSDPMFPPFEDFFGTIVFAVPMQWRMWFVALCMLQAGSIWVPKCWCSCNSMCSCVLGCMLACWTPFCGHEGVRSA